MIRTCLPTLKLESMSHTSKCTTHLVGLHNLAHGAGKEPRGRRRHEHVCFPTTLVFDPAADKHRHTWLASTTSRTARTKSSVGGAGMSMRAAPFCIRSAFLSGRKITMRPLALRCACRVFEAHKLHTCQEVAP